MSETTATPAEGTWGTVRPYGLSMSDGRGNPAELRALYVGAGPGPWSEETGKRAIVYVLELESGERFVVESAAVLARVFRADAPVRAAVWVLLENGRPVARGTSVELAPVEAARIRAGVRPSQLSHAATGSASDVGATPSASRYLELLASPFPLGRL